MLDAAGDVLRLLAGLATVFLAGCGPLNLITAGGAGFRLPERLALSFGLGALLITLWMLALSFLGVPFTLVWTAGPPVLTSFLLWRLRERRAGLPCPASAPLQGWDWLVVGLLGLVVVYTVMRAALYPMWTWDALALWGFKAKLLFYRRTLDFTGFEIQTYYPNLIPLLLAYLYLWLGEVNDHLVQAVFSLWGALLLVILYHQARRAGLTRRQALILTTFFATNGTVFLEHAFIAYADLPLAYYTLAAAGPVFFWLQGISPPGSLVLAAFSLAAMGWTKFEGPPLAGTILLAATLTLLWVRPHRLKTRLAQVAGLLAGLILGIIPWRLYCHFHHIEVGIDHVASFYPQQLLQALPYLAATLFDPEQFGVLWPAFLLAAICGGKSLFTTPRLFLPLFIAGNLAAVLLAYAIAPTSAAEFPLYIRATANRLLLHITPVVALFLADTLANLEKAEDSEALTERLY
jgi:hypothetical protein